MRCPKPISPTRNTALQWRVKQSIFNNMKVAVQKKLKGEDWLEECFEYERTHEIAFASPRALLEARLIAELDKARSPHRRAHRNGIGNGKTPTTHSRRKAA